jgi:DNA-binding MarR family transcriptional regulator
MKKEAIEFQTRKHIYNTISKHPGLHIRELSRRTDIPFSTMKYHLSYLQKKEFINSRKEEGHTRFYVIEKVNDKHNKILSMLRGEISNKIILYLLFNPGLADPRELFWRRAFPNIPQHERVVLHLGCGGNYIRRPGFINIDGNLFGPKNLWLDITIGLPFPDWMQGLFDKHGPVLDHLSFVVEDIKECTRSSGSDGSTFSPWQRIRRSRSRGF